MEIWDICSNLTCLKGYGSRNVPFFFGVLNQNHLAFLLCLIEILSNGRFPGKFRIRNRMMMNFLCLTAANLNQRNFTLYKTILKGYMHSRKLTWKLKIPPWKRKIIFQTPNLWVPAVRFREVHTFCNPHRFPRKNMFTLKIGIITTYWPKHLNNEKELCCLGYIEDYTSQLQ